MVELINSDFVKLLSILLAIVALFYIGVKNKPTNGMTKNIHVWYICGIATFLIVELITFIVVGNADAQNIMDNISFASTLSSLILSVLAIFITVLSGESMNKLRDSLIGLGSIPNDVKQAVNETIDKMQKSTEDLDTATEANNKNLEKLNEFFDTKIAEIEHHISDQLKLHQQTTLKAIDERFVGKKEGTQNEPSDISEPMIDIFLSSTSNASISLLYMISRYCEKVNRYHVDPPIVNLNNLALAINEGKREDSFGMYLFACLVILSSFGLLDYEAQENQMSDVTFSSVNKYLMSKIPEQFNKRDMLKASEGLDNYIDSLFTNNKHRHIFIFPDLVVAEGDFIWLYTKNGSYGTHKNTSGTNTHKIYWGLKNHIWNNEGDKAYLMHYDDWESLAYKVPDSK